MFIHMSLFLLTAPFFDKSLLAQCYPLVVLLGRKPQSLNKVLGVSILSFVAVLNNLEGYSSIIWLYFKIVFGAEGGPCD